ncbi:hypothetical protein WME91_19620 [Sorangium sp. So ce269]
MHSRIGLATVALVEAPACGAADEPTDAGGEQDGRAEADPLPRSFAVSLDPVTTAETVIPRMLEAGRHELTAACADRPEASIRVFSPLDPGAHGDVPCASMRCGEAEASTEPALDADSEPIGAAQQPWSPIGLGCGIFLLGATRGATSVLCPMARDPRDAQRCSDTSGAALGTLGVFCGFL